MALQVQKNRNYVTIIIIRSQFYSTIFFKCIIKTTKDTQGCVKAHIIKKKYITGENKQRIAYSFSW